MCFVSFNILKALLRGLNRKLKNENFHFSMNNCYKPTEMASLIN